MILPDANILIYAHNEASENHEKAKQWLEEKLQGSEIICFSWQTITAFLRILTNSKLFLNPLTSKQAFEIVEQWLLPERRHFRTDGKFYNDFSKGGG